MNIIMDDLLIDRMDHLRRRLLLAIATGQRATHLRRESATLLAAMGDYWATTGQQIDGDLADAYRGLTDAVIEAGRVS